MNASYFFAFLVIRSVYCSAERSIVDHIQAARSGCRSEIAQRKEFWLWFWAVLLGRERRWLFGAAVRFNLGHDCSSLIII